MFWKYSCVCKKITGKIYTLPATKITRVVYSTLDVFTLLLDDSQRDQTIVNKNLVCSCGYVVRARVHVCDVSHRKGPGVIVCLCMVV